MYYCSDYFNINSIKKQLSNLLYSQSVTPSLLVVSNCITYFCLFSMASLTLGNSVLSSTNSVLFREEEEEKKHEL